MAIRIVSVLVILFSIFFMPFWVFVLMVAAGIIYFDIFAESLVLLLLSDILYAARSGKFGGVFFLTTILGGVALILAEILKKRLKFYNK